MTPNPSPEQHRALLHDCWAIAEALPTSGVLDRARRPYRAIRFERKLDDLANDPSGLLEYIRGMARRTSEGLDALVQYDRLDLSVETLIIDESRLYAPLFTVDDRNAAKAKLARRAGRVEEVARDRTQELQKTKAARQERISAIRSSLPEEIDQVKALAIAAGEPEEAVAVNTSILEKEPSNVVALNRLGRAYEAIGLPDEAMFAFQRALELDPNNRIAAGRLRRLERRS
jgi:tetratricopeptide (TPR) repeat protein